MSFLGIYIILKLSFGVSTRGFLDFLLGGIGDGCRAIGLIFGLGVLWRDISGATDFEFPS